MSHQNQLSDMTAIKFIIKNSLLFLCVILASFLISCNKHEYNDIEIAEQLDKVLTGYIDKYGTDSVIRVSFSKAENHIDMLIYHEPFYDKNYVDGCFEKQGKLIVYHSDYEGLVDSLITPYYSKNKDLLDKYKKWVLADADINRDFQEYCILAKDKIVQDPDIKHVYSQKVISEDGVLSPAVNRLINERLNSNGCLVTSVYFSSKDNEDYLYINSGRLVDYKNLYGCIERGNRIVTFHSVEKLRNKNIVDTIYIKKCLPMLSPYKFIPEDDISIYMELANCYKIVSSDSVIIIK